MVKSSGIRICKVVSEAERLELMVKSLVIVSVILEGSPRAILSSLLTVTDDS